ncbi:DUF5723 family protein [Tellurirhabdus rosea]|uniref:DUF5723 family protein n=1 Tax=Tellurirhabdus rosea TaxID=2674997 RepID=UPI00225AFCCA|nr:DUF5723 family protein [Tellurirhabdus rosea]
MALNLSGRLENDVLKSGPAPIFVQLPTRTVLNMNLKNFLLALTLSSLLTVSASGQYLAGHVNSNYAGTNSLYHNPAFAADSRYRVHVNLATADAFINNNFLRWNAPFSFISLISGNVPRPYRNEKGLVRWEKSYMQETQHHRPKHVASAMDLRGPSLLINLNPRWGLGLTTRVRTGVGMRRVSENLARQLYNSKPDEVATDELFYENQRGYAALNSAFEMGGTVGYVLADNEEDFWKVGLTLKRLVGLYNAHIHLDRATYELIGNPGDKAYEALAIHNANGELGYTSFDGLANFRFTPGWLLGRAAAGGGWGADLGVVYEHRPDVRRYRYRDGKHGMQKDASQNKYQYRISASLTDLGGIRYRNANYVTNYPVNVENKLLTKEFLGEVKDLDDVTNGFVSALGISDAEKQSRMNASLPTALQLSVDYKVRPHVYVNALWVQSLTGARSRGMRTPSMVGVVPRWETRWAEVSLPVLWQADYSNLSVGAAVRLGTIFVGSDNLAGILNVGKPRGASVYAGAGIPLFRPAPTNPNACYQPWRRKGLLDWFRRD